MLRFPENDPVAFGVNVTTKVQFAPGASVKDAVHVPVPVLLNRPLVLTLDTIRFAVPVLVSTVVCPALTVF
jgi:hypothetical protein